MTGEDAGEWRIQIKFLREGLYKAPSTLAAASILAKFIVIDLETTLASRAVEASLGGATLPFVEPSIVLEAARPGSFLFDCLIMAKGAGDEAYEFFKGDIGSAIANAIEIVLAAGGAVGLLKVLGERVFGDRLRQFRSDLRDPEVRRDLKTLHALLEETGPVEIRFRGHRLKLEARGFENLVSTLAGGVLNEAPLPGLVVEVVRAAFGVLYGFAGKDLESFAVQDEDFSKMGAKRGFDFFTGARVLAQDVDTDNGRPILRHIGFYSPADSVEWFPVPRSAPDGARRRVAA